MIPPTDPLYSLALTATATATATKTSTSGKHVQFVSTGAPSSSSSHTDVDSVSVARMYLHDDRDGERERKGDERYGGVREDSEEYCKGETEREMERETETVGGVWMPKIGKKQNHLKSTMSYSLVCYSYFYQYHFITIYFTYFL